MKVLLLQKTYIFWHILQRLLFLLHAISLHIPCVSSPSLRLFWQIHTWHCTLTQSPKGEVFKAVIGPAQCQSRKEPMGRWSTRFMGRSVSGKKTNAYFFFDQCITPALTQRRQLNKTKRMGRRCTSFMGRLKKKKKVWDVSAQKARRPTGHLPGMPDYQSSPDNRNPL